MAIRTGIHPPLTAAQFEEIAALPDFRLPIKDIFPQ
jgi:hypothetical protein